MNILITGASGFVGRNLVQALRLRSDVELCEYDLGVPEQQLWDALGRADVIYHLAGVNRPPSAEQYEEGNAGFTQEICKRLLAADRSPKIVFASSTQAELDNPYGLSKLHAEESLRQFSEATGARVTIFRWTNLFGKWCRPNYNSVTATFCHNIAHGLPIQISDPSREVELAYIDDVVAGLLAELDRHKEVVSGQWSVVSGQGTEKALTPGPSPAAGEGSNSSLGPSPAAGEGSNSSPGDRGTVPFSSDENRDSPLVVLAYVQPTYRATLGELAATVQSFRDSRTNLRLPELSDRFIRCLYATYLSYLPEGEFAYPLDIKSDNRGELAEFLKSPHIGQLFVSRTKPGVTRGNHYHHTKTEKFLVLQGDAVIRFRHIESDHVVAYPVSGKEFRVLDIPPGYTHSIENVGTEELVVLFWVSEVFDPSTPDTYAADVLKKE